MRVFRALVHVKGLPFVDEDSITRIGGFYQSHWAEGENTEEAMAKIKQRVESDSTETDSYRLARPGSVEISFEEIELLDTKEAPAQLKTGKAYYLEDLENGVATKT